jgi:hypothetical protein
VQYDQLSSGAALLLGDTSAPVVRLRLLGKNDAADVASLAKRFGFSGDACRDLRVVLSHSGVDSLFIRYCRKRLELAESNAGPRNLFHPSWYAGDPFPARLPPTSGDYGVAFDDGFHGALLHCLINAVIGEVKSNRVLKSILPGA